MRSRKSTVIPDTHKNPVSVTVSAVFPGGKLRENPVQATCHPFYAGFRLISRMQRLTGCCFLENIGCHNYQDVRAKRSSLYLLYPICIWIYVLTVAVVILVDSEQHKHGVRGADQLNKTIWLASIVALSMEAVLNNVVLFYRAPELVELLRTCGLIELYVNVPPYRQREAVRSAWVIIAFQLADIALNMALDIYADFGTLVLVEKERTMAPFPMATLVSFGFLGIFFLAAHGLSARVLLTKVLQVDHARAQLSLVMKCADLASFILGPSLLYAYTYSVPLLCASAYYTIVAEFPFRVRLFFLFFFMLHYLSILVPPLTGAVITYTVVLAQTSSAKKRQRYSNYAEVEVYFLIDTMFSERFPEDTKAINYLAVTLAAVNLRYKSVRSMDIKFIAVGMLRLTSELQEEFVIMDGSYVDGQPTLVTLKMFCHRRGLDTADVRYFITGLDITGTYRGRKNPIMGGYAYVGGLCSLDGVAIGEDTPGLYRGVDIMAHELAHSLGCVHDGEGSRTELPGHKGSTAPECAAYHGYLMSYSRNGGKNHYKFSPCCEEQIKLLLRWSPTVLASSAIRAPGRPYLYRFPNGFIFPNTLLFWVPGLMYCEGYSKEEERDNLLPAFPRTAKTGALSCLEKWR
ncbi:hypothetical protein HPB50_003253 [Hyalomma asiaticum]|uniref:Uncharacterized protein n=1 Tax=Hyalomma asiaticum TaxID=266040 RepID=A0ACB7RL26_HYAAI|nr:hypothetical protein HPB50_003253 [Hyalomma asiaticum]